MTLANNYINLWKEEEINNRFHYSKYFYNIFGYLSVYGYKKEDSYEFTVFRNDVWYIVSTIKDKYLSVTELDDFEKLTKFLEVEPNANLYINKPHTFTKEDIHYNIKNVLIAVYDHCEWEFIDSKEEYDNIYNLCGLSYSNHYIN